MNINILNSLLTQQKMKKILVGFIFLLLILCFNLTQVEAQCGEPIPTGIDRCSNCPSTNAGEFCPGEGGCFTAYNLYPITTNADGSQCYCKQHYSAQCIACPDDPCDLECGDSAMNCDVCPSNCVTRYFCNPNTFICEANLVSDPSTGVSSESNCNSSCFEKKYKCSLQNCFVSEGGPYSTMDECTENCGPSMYECNGSTCQKDNANGTYTTSWCDNACSSTAPMYECNGSTCQRDDTNGTYTSSTCNGNCNTSTTPMYECNGSICQRDDTNGTYTSSTCNGNCSTTTAKYECNGTSCDRDDSNGSYTSSSCNGVCTMTIASYNCSGGTCSSSILGTYSSLSACQSACIVPCSTIPTAVSSSQTICEGETFTNLTATGATTYQWQSSINNTTFTNIAGATAVIYNAPETAGTRYYRTIGTTSGCTGTSSSVTLIINAEPTPTVTTSQTICEGETFTNLVASGSTTYQWQSSLNNTTFANIAGATAATYNAPETAGTRYYRAIGTTNSCSGSSPSVTLIAKADPTPSVSVDQTICIGDVFTDIEASGATTYQWQSSMNNTTFTNVAGATAAIYSASDKNIGTIYYRVVGTDNGCSINSPSIALEVEDCPIYSIGSTVWSDVNNNGTLDAGEEALGSGGTIGKEVILSLYDAINAVLVKTTQTDANGSYYFGELVAGDYYIEFTPPISLPISSTGSSAGDDQMDNDDNGIQEDTDGDIDGVTDGLIQSVVINLSFEDEPTSEPGINGDKDSVEDDNGDMTIDFGLYGCNETLEILGPSELCGDEAGQFQVSPPLIGATYVWSATGNPAISFGSSNSASLQYTWPIDAGNFIVSLETISSTGCIYRNDFPVIVNQGVFADGGGNVDVCQGGEITLDGSNSSTGDTYLWTVVTGDITSIDGGGTTTTPTMSPLFSTLYELTVTDPVSNCSKVSRVEVAIDVNKNPTAELASSNNICAGTEITLDGSGSAAPLSDPTSPLLYTFYEGSVPTGNVLQSGSTDNISLTPLVTTEYALVVESQSGCLDTSLITMVVRPCLSIGSTVWSDDNNNGAQDLGEESIGSGSKIDKAVVLELYDASNGALISTTQTDSNGSYLFGGLLPGNYYIEFTPPASLPVSSTGARGDDGVDGDDNGMQSDTNGDGITDGVISSPILQLALNSEPTNEPGSNGNKDDGNDGNGDMTIDFGLVPLMSIGSTVWSDDNNNGVQDPGEPSLGSGSSVGKSVVLELYNADTNALVATTITDSEGSYAFDNLLPGDYYISFLPPPSLSKSSTSNSGDDGVDGNDNGIQEDTNGDGVTDGTITSATITLSPETEPRNESGKNNEKGTAKDGNGDMTIDFGLVPCEDVSGEVFVDVNTNGCKDILEQPIPGVEVTLYVCAAATGQVNPSGGFELATTTTDSRGQYIFDNCLDPALEYYVEFEIPSGYNITSQDVCGDPDDSDINTQSRTRCVDPSTPESDNLDAGIIPVMSIGSTVWSDDDNNGVQDNGETSLGSGTLAGKSVVLQLYDAITNGLIATTRTDNNGSYLFAGLEPGSYYIEFTPPASLPVSSTGVSDDDGKDGDDNGIQLDTDGDGVSDGLIITDIIFLIGGSEPVGEPGKNGNKDLGEDANGDMTIDFGLVPPDVQMAGMSIGSTLWSDDNNNGIQDPGEESLGTGSKAGKSVSLELYNASTNVLVSRTQTDANGSYLFTGLAEGMYYIEFTPPSSLPTSSTGASGDDGVDGNDNGMQRDTNGDGVTDGIINSSIINLAAGTEPRNESGVHGNKDAGNDGNGDMTIDFGLVPPSTPVVEMTIGSTVWSDDNNNGIFDIGEEPLGTGSKAGKSVILRLYDASNNALVATTQTDNNGSYTFTGLEEGQYYLEFTPPASLPISSTGVSGDNGIDNNDNGMQSDTNGDGVTDGIISSSIIQLVANTEPTGETGIHGNKDTGNDANGDMTIDFGLVPAAVAPEELSIGSTIFSDDNDNGIQDPGEDSLGTGSKIDKAVVLELYSATTGSLVATTASDASGSYTFSGLAEGMYYIEFTPPSTRPVSSTGTSGDDGVDGNDNGMQVDTNGDGVTDGTISSGTINLVAGQEPVGEIGVHGNKDAGNDANGDMTIDFGLVPIGQLPGNIFDLAIKKELDQHIDMNGNGFSNPGDDYVFKITLYNQGEVDASNVEVIDYLPEGMTLSSSDTNGWMSTTGMSVTKFVSGVAAGNSVELFIRVNVSSSYSGNSIENVAEILDDGSGTGGVSEDIDSTPDGDPLDDVIGADNAIDNNNGDEDDHDPALLVFDLYSDLSLEKRLSSGQGGVVEPGELVSYTIEVTNAGMITADNIVLRDYVPTGLSFDPQRNTAWQISGEYAETTLSVQNGLLPAGGLPPGNTFSIIIVLSVNANVPPGSIIDNEAEVTAHTNLSGTDMNDTVSTNNTDTEKIQTATTDLGIEKMVTPGQNIEPGDIVDFTITVTNHGTTTIGSVYITDTYPTYLTLADANWLAGPVANTATLTDMINLAPGASKDYQVSFQLSMYTPGMVMTNEVEITMLFDNNGDLMEDENPSNDVDNANISVASILTYDIELEKRVSTNTSYPHTFGSTVEFEIVIRNASNASVADIVIEDVLGNGYQFSQSQNPGWSYLPGSASTYTYEIPSLAMDTEIIIPMYTMIKSNGLYENTAEIMTVQTAFGTPLLDIDSTPGNHMMDEDDIDMVALTPMAPLGAIGDRVWKDVNADGIQSIAEQNLNVSDLKVSLYNSSGTLVAIDYTDGDGNYMFMDLFAGQYYVGVEVPEGCELSEPFNGNNANSDSNIDHSNGPNTSPIINLGHDEIDRSIDIGLFSCIELGDIIWYDSNGNNVQDSFEGGINGVVVKVYKYVNGQPVLVERTITGHKPGTASDDGYWKVCVAPGDYYVEFVVSDRLRSVVPGIGGQDFDSNVTGANGTNTTSRFTITGGNHRCDVDAGFRLSTFARSEEIQFSATAQKGGLLITEIQGLHKKSYNEITWSAIHEGEGKHYVIEKESSNGEYVSIAKILSKDVASEEKGYSYQDYDYNAGNNKYRVFIVDDIDNSIEIGQQEVLVPETNKTRVVKLYPTVTSGDVNLQIETQEVTRVIASVYTINGEQVGSTEVDNYVDGVEIFTIETTTLTPGLYNVRVIIGNEVINKKLIKVYN